MAFLSQVIKKSVPRFLVNRYKKYKETNKINSYRGDNVFCPICASYFREFAPGGTKKRRNARCVNCGSLERHRLLYLYLGTKKDILRRSSHFKLLHFAPMKSYYKIFSQSPNLEYVPCDLFPERYNFKGRVKTLKVDITDIPFEDDYFDAILCNHVLEHIPDDRLALSELYRVMKRGGWGIFQVPIDYTLEKTYEDFTITKPKDRLKAFGQSDHVRWYGRDYPERLRNAGFELTEDSYVQEFSSYELYRFGLNPLHLIYHCQK